jgi:hypothetical protein
MNLVRHVGHFKTRVLTHLVIGNIWLELHYLFISKPKRFDIKQFKVGFMKIAPIVHRFPGAVVVVIVC